LGTGIELEIARINRVLSRVRETRIVNWYWPSLNREPRVTDDNHSRLIQIRRHTISLGPRRGDPCSSVF
jgi:hypothetical protein